MKQCCGPRRAVQSVKAVGIDLHGLFVFGKRSFGAFWFQQHIGKHLARRQGHLAFAASILEVSSLAHQTERVVVSLFRKIAPGEDIIMLDIEKLSPVTFFGSLQIIK